VSRARNQASRQCGRRGPRGLLRGIAREETTQRLVRPVGVPHRATQAGVRESLVHVLVGTLIAVDICINDACYYEVASYYWRGSSVSCMLHGFQTYVLAARPEAGVR